MYMYTYIYKCTIVMHLIHMLFHMLAYVFGECAPNGSSEVRVQVGQVSIGDVIARRLITHWHQSTSWEEKGRGGGGG